MPIETLIYAKQEGYYKALNASLKADGKIIRHGASKNGYGEVL